MNLTNVNQDHIRNVAIIAHIDHGKTTLVDHLLKQAHVFRDNAQEFSQTLIMDSNTLERERGITILAKNTSITYQDYRINIIDTPGHADFGGEVERTLTMADGVILLVDAQEGVMPQTRVVLQKALQYDLKPIVIINKIDKQARRVAEVLDEIHSLFLELAHHENQLDFPVLYAIGREGKAFATMPTDDELGKEATLEPLFHEIVKSVPAPKGDRTAPFQLRISALDQDDFKGVYAIGKIERGNITARTAVVILNPDGSTAKATVQNVYIWEGLKRIEVESAGTGDIVALTGFDKILINATLADPSAPEALTPIAIEEPTLKISVGANTSPFVGREGTLLTSRQIRDRLEKELETNVSLRMEGSGDRFTISGRGELHLSILLENLRREGFELEVGKPMVVTKVENGVTMEPVEEVMIDVPEVYRGVIISELAKRQALLIDNFPHAADIRFVYEMPTKSLLGLRSVLLTLTRGSFTLNARFLRFAPLTPPLAKQRRGVIIASESGKATAFGLDIAQGRGKTFIAPGTEVYQGMIVGENAKDEDMIINVAKGKQLTNMRSTSSDGIVQLAPPVIMTLEQCLNFIEDDELLEITPGALRLRKKHLSQTERDRYARDVRNSKS